MFGHLLWLLLHVSMSMRGEAERVPCARILFIHIPKTGGESVKATLRKSFPSFNFLDHRSYDWKSLYKREVRKGKKAPRNLIIEHHVQSEAFGNIWKDIPKLQNIWEEKKCLHFSFVVIRESEELALSAYSYCSRPRFVRNKQAMPKLWHNVVNCQDRNVMITYLTTRNWCGKNGVRHPLRDSGNMSNAHFEDDTMHVEDACSSNKDIGIWFDALRIYDMTELDILAKEINSAFVGLGRIRQFKRTNSSPIPSAKSLHKLSMSRLPFVSCKYSESNRKRLLKFAARGSNREIDEEIKSQAIRHISCDQHLYKSLRNRGNMGAPKDWDNGFEKMI